MPGPFSGCIIHLPAVLVPFHPGRQPHCVTVMIIGGEKAQNIVGKILKVAFFQKVRFVFPNLQISKKNIPKNYPELEI